MKVNSTNIFFHYPVEVNFYLGTKKGDVALSDWVKR